MTTENFSKLTSNTKQQIQKAQRTHTKKDKCQKTKKQTNQKTNQLYLGILFTNQRSILFQARFTDIKLKQLQPEENVYLTHSLKDKCTDVITI